MHFCGCQMRSNEIKWGHSTCKAGVATSLLGELKQNTASNSSDSYADPDPLAWGSCSTPCYSPFSDRKCYQKGKPLTIVYHLMGKWLNVIHFKVLHQPLTILSIKSVLHCYNKNRTFFVIACLLFLNHHEPSMSGAKCLQKWNGSQMIANIWPSNSTRKIRNTCRAHNDHGFEPFQAREPWLSSIQRRDHPTSQRNGFFMSHKLDPKSTGPSSFSPLKVILQELNEAMPIHAPFSAALMLPSGYLT